MAPAAGVSETLMAALCRVALASALCQAACVVNRQPRSCGEAKGLWVKAEAPLVRDRASPCISSPSALHAFYSSSDFCVCLPGWPWITHTYSTHGICLFHNFLHPAKTYYILLTHLHLIFLSSLPLWPRGIWFGWARDKRDVSACGTEQTHLSFLPFFSPALSPLPCPSPFSSPLSSLLFSPDLLTSFISVTAGYN